ncbi:MAG: zf-HC2 domain-containing protein [Ilumatobacteraceae bacterium]
MSFRGRLEHLRYRRFLDAAIDGELTGEQARRVRAHVSACPRCARDEDLTLTIKRRLGLIRLLRPSNHPPHH